MNISKLFQFAKSQIKGSLYACRDVISVIREGNFESQIIKTVHYEDKDFVLPYLRHREIPVLKNDWFFASVGQGSVPAGCLVRGPIGYTILVNSAWEKADPDIKEALVAHELGHLACGHLKRKVSLAELMFAPIARAMGDQRMIDLEIEADVYAIKEGHKEGLVKLLEIYQKFAEELGMVANENYQRLWAIFGAKV